MCDGDPATPGVDARMIPYANVLEISVMLPEEACLKYQF